MSIPFHPLIQEWFHERLGKPTRIQEMAWKSISEGAHTLLTAPTGSGKTLAAFLWSINQLYCEEKKEPGISILYISPLKALNNDIKRNLEQPLEEIESLFRQKGVEVPSIRTAIRSGDTPQYERQRMLKNPPDIFITTPESLHILLTSGNGRRMLQGIKTVILDEIHALQESRRGVLLSTALERLVERNGEFQRIALSATVHPLERAAGFVGGYSPQGDSGMLPRKVRILEDKGQKRYDITITAPLVEDDEERWAGIARQCLDIIHENQSTLFFTDSRRVTEKAARLINDLAGETLVWAHHGSLARELRFEVEQRMKQGELRAIVATSSLELGIDIGNLDRVVLLQSPSSQSSMLQRIGRAGHGVGETSQATLIPLHPGELLQSAALMECINEGTLEEIRPLMNTLDVLAQLILSITHDAWWQEEALFRMLQRCWTYHQLPREHFDLILEMLEGRYSGSTLKELQPRIIRNRLEGTVKARDKGAWLIYTSGGVIPDRGYYDLRTQDGHVKIGDLDEEFVWERNPGESFTLGNQVWKIVRITNQMVEVKPAEGVIRMVPFWRAEDMNRSPLLSRVMGEILDQARENHLSDRLLDEWQKRYHFSSEAAEELLGYFRSQEEKSKAPLPGYRHILFEHCRDNGGGEITEQLIIHTFRGGSVNQPLALALVQAWKKATGVELPFFVNNDGITLLSAGPLEPQELLNQLFSHDLMTLLRSGLNGTPFFGARFRECAGRALLLPKKSIHRRTPLWLTRLRAKKLLGAVERYDDFPILLETWRTCLEDHYDMAELQGLLDDLKSGEVSWSLCHSTLPSPFASSLVWRQVNLHMYGDDTPTGSNSQSLSDSLLRDLMGSSQLRPPIPRAIIEELESRLQRLRTGYGADSPEELELWLNQRLFMEQSEWDAFIETSITDSGLSRDALLAPISDKLLHQGSLVMLQQNKEIYSTLIEENDSPAASQAENILLDLLKYLGPLSLKELSRRFSLPMDRLEALLTPLVEEGQLILDRISEDAEDPQLCSQENLEYLLRLARKERQYIAKPRPAEDLPLMLAQRQGLIHRSSSSEDLQNILDVLIGLPLQVELIESSIFPCRYSWYNPQWLDALLSHSELIYHGEGEKYLSFLFPDEISLWSGRSSEGKPEPLPPGRHDFFQLRQFWGTDSQESARKLWEGLWQGAWSNQDFQVIRKGIDNRFKLPRKMEEGGHSGRNRRQLSRWKTERPLDGFWYNIPQAEESSDELEEMERGKERVRQLLSRYGILCKVLLQKESSIMGWRALFPALRLMELSGELISGQFYTGIQGMQFTTESYLKEWKQLDDWKENLWYINAQDPASLCGNGPDAPWQGLPRRMPANWMVYRGAKLMMVLEKNGTSTHCFYDTAEEFQPLNFWEMLLCREQKPLKKILLEQINEEPAAESEYAESFREQGFQVSGDKLILRRKY